eukprot:PhF_6_TR1468/c0_g1_i2/m.2645
MRRVANRYLMRSSVAASLSASFMMRPYTASFNNTSSSTMAFTPSHLVFNTPMRSYATEVTGLTPEAITQASTVVITSFNFEKEIVKATVPILMVFGMDSNPESKQFTNNMKAAAVARNKEDNAISVRVATVNCERELSIAKQFRVEQMGLPLTFFLYKGQLIDRAQGVLQDVHIKQAMDTFVNVVKTQLEPQDAQAKMQAGRMSEDEENPMTLLSEGARKLQQTQTDIPAAKKLFQKAYDMCKKEIAELKKNIGVGQRKITPEMQLKLKDNPYTLAAARALSCLSTCEMAENNYPKAYEYAQEIRSEYPYLVKEHKEVAESVVRIELTQLVNFDPLKHQYATLLKKDDVIKDPEEFYALHLRLAVCHFVDKKPELCVEELLKLIRAEAKLGKAPKKSGETTIARKAILLTFEGMGNDHPVVIEARKKLAAYLFC